jgi:hypothetical protein
MQMMNNRQGAPHVLLPCDLRLHITSEVHIVGSRMCRLHKCLSPCSCVQCYAFC